MFTAADIVETGTDGGDDDEEGESKHEDEEGERGGVKERNSKYGDKIGGSRTRKICLT